MKKLIGSVLAMLVTSVVTAADVVIDGVIFSSNATPAATYPAGETEVTAKYNVSSTIGGASVKNAVGAYAAAADGAVIKPVLASGTTKAELCLGLKVDSGTVTLDLTSLGDAPFQFRGSLWVADGATLIIKGRSSIDFGDTSADGNYMPSGIRAQSLTFVDALGQPYAMPSLHFTGYFTEIRIPGNVDWDIADGTMVFIHKSIASGVMARYAEGGADDVVKTFPVSNFDVTLLDPDGVQNLSFYVSPGRSLRLLPRTVKYELGYPLNGNSLTAEFSNDVVLGGAGDNPAQFVLGYHHNMTYSGNVTGSGTVLQSWRAATGANEKTTITGVLGHTGEFKMECTASPPRATVVVKQAVPGADGVKVTLGAGCELRLDPADAESGIIGELAGDATATLSISPKASVTLGSAPTGGLTIAGTTTAVPTVSRGWTLAAGESFVEGEADGVNWVLSPSVAAVTRKLDWGTTCHAYYQPTVEGGVLRLPNMTLPAGRGPLTLVAVNGEKYANVPAGVKVLAQAGVSATVVVEDNDTVELEAEEGATLATERVTFDYATEADLWFDASDTESRTLYNGQNAVDIWYDCRGTRTDLFLRNDKYNLNNSSIAPVPTAYGLNDLTYFAMTPGNRRTAFWTPQMVADMDASVIKAWGYDYNSFNPNYCIMVFGSQAGGGCGLLAEKSEYFARGGKPTDKTTVTADTPIFDNAIPIYVDGESVDAQTTGLSGGWQILSFPTSGKQIGGLGCSSSYSSTGRCGNANYAEVLFFDRELTDVERVTVERYLANKWGLSSTYHDTSIGTGSVTVSARGKGTIKLGTTTVIAAGSFRGNLDLNGQQVSYANASLPPTSSSVVTTGVEPVNWFDPSLADKKKVNNNVSLMELYDVRYGKEDGTSYLQSAGRYPYLVTSARGDGQELTWFEMSPALYDGASANGRCVRFNVLGSGKATTTIDGAPSAKTVILVQDSSKSGGTPFMDTVAGSTLAQRNPKYDENGPTTADKPIWVGNSATTLAAATTYLDGAALDGTKIGFSGGPEILSVVNDTAFTPAVFGNLYYLNGRSPNDIDAGEIFGEIVIYDQVLGETQRKDVEAYLAWKWMGKAINGYASYSGMTLSGAGSVRVDSFDQMPKFAGGFTGTVELPNVTALNFSVDPQAGTVEGKVTGAGALQFPANVDLTVAFTSKLTPGKFTLVEAAGGLDQTAWQLNFAGTAPTREVKLNVTPTKVELEIVRTPLLIMIY